MSDTIIEKGIVVGLEKDRARVEFVEQSACSTCSSRIICSPGSSGRRAILADNQVHAEVGNHVLVAETGNIEMKMAGLQYGIPMFGFIAGIVALNLSSLTVPHLPRELLLFGGGLVGLLLSGFTSWTIAGRMAEKTTSYFKITEILTP